MTSTIRNPIATIANGLKQAIAGRLGRIRMVIRLVMLGEITDTRWAKACIDEVWEDIERLLHSLRVFPIRTLKKLASGRGIHKAEFLPKAALAEAIAQHIYGQAKALEAWQAQKAREYRGS